MTQQQWQLVEDLFHAALERPESERQRFLDQACGGDAELRAEVESLVGSDPSTDPDTPADRSPIADRVRRAAILVAFPPRQGDRIGQYQIVEEIGHGGMGLVYRASRADQEFHKQVAIKVAKTGMDTATVLERFRRERQILASLDHRYVAKLLDGGTTEDGLPYFVMEYVQGDPIHRYARAKNLSVRERLVLFRGVLEAVAYAHQNLVVHLDLKPSNILIAADGTPKLLDFGISRLLEPGRGSSESDSGPNSHTHAEPTSPPGMTALGRLMTPDYASPEQIRGQALTTATDVYALGAVLYQLLTGELPHQLEGLSPRQVEREICFLDVIRPSDRAPALRRELAGDVDNIVLKAMAKDSTRRYRTAQELDDELRRYLEDLPVRAVSGSRFYRAQKFLARNHLFAVSAAAVFVSLLGGLVVASWQAGLAERQRRVAVTERNRAERNASEAQRNATEAQANARRAATATIRAEQALKDAEAAQRDAVAQRQLADHRFEDVHKLSTSYLFEFNDALAASPGTLKVRRKMVDQGLGFLDGLVKEAGSNANLRLDLAGAYMRLGDVLGHPDMANLGDTKAALANYRKALPLTEPPAAARGNRNGAEKVDPDEYLLAGLEAQHKIGEVLTSTGPAREAFAEYDRAVRIARDLLTRHEGDLRFDLEIAGTLTHQTYALSTNNSHQACLAAVRENYPLLTRLMERHPEEAEFRVLMANNYSSEGRSLGFTGDLKGSLAAYQKNIDLLESLQRDFPAKARPRLLMLAYSHLGDGLGNPSLPNVGDYAGAVAAFEKMIRIADAAAAADPQNNLVHLDAAMSAGRLGGVRLAQGDAAGALPALQKAVAGLEGVVAKDPHNRSYLRFLLTHYELSGDALDSLGRLADAKAVYAKVIAESERVLPSDPEDGMLSADLTEGHLKLGLILSREGSPQAMEQINLALNQNQRYREAHPDQVLVKLRSARCLGGRALAAYRLASRPGVSSTERNQQLTQAREDITQADQIVAALPPQRRDLVVSRSLALIAEARKLLAEAH